MGKKPVLIICYYWPPAGGPGVQRWLKFVKYLGEFEIEPIVFVPDNPHYPIIDESFEAEVPDDVEVIRFPIKEPYRFAKWLSTKKTQEISKGIIAEKGPSFLEKTMLYARGNLFIPDARIGWVKPSVRFLTHFLKESKIGTVITTGPPHSLHLIGMRLKKDLGMRWIADFRDPWTTIHYHRSLRLTKASEKKHKELEQEVLNKADAVVVTSENTKKEFAEITKSPIVVITNGFDITEEITPQPDKTFSLAHVGSLLTERNPEVLWKVLSQICKENAVFSQHIQVKLAGAVGEEVKESVSRYGLKEYTRFLGYVSHKEAVQIQHDAQILLLVEMDRLETRAIIPGKLFEYLRARRPILALGPEGSDIQPILKETKSGQFFLYAEEEQLKAQILRYFDAFLVGELTPNTGDIEKYSRRELTKEMAALIRETTPVQ